MTKLISDCSLSQGSIILHSKDLRDLPVLVVHPNGQNRPLIVRPPPHLFPKVQCCPRHPHGAYETTRC